jgi:hypothetical protein
LPGDRCYCDNPNGDSRSMPRYPTRQAALFAGPAVAGGALFAPNDLPNHMPTDVLSYPWADHPIDLDGARRSRSSDVASATARCQSCRRYRMVTPSFCTSPTTRADCCNSSENTPTGKDCRLVRHQQSNRCLAACYRTVPGTQLPGSCLKRAQPSWGQGTRRGRPRAVIACDIATAALPEFCASSATNSPCATAPLTDTATSPSADITPFVSTLRV